MEHQLWKFIVSLVNEIDQDRFNPHERFSDDQIVLVYYWSVIHDRPVSWACWKRNWPIAWRRRPLPSCTTMSRRLRSASVVALLEAVDHRMHQVDEGLFWMIDGKPLPIGGCSKDPDARYGRSAGGKAKGYKLHALANSVGIVAWQVRPMNVDERAVAEELLATPGISGYVVADANYDSNKLHRICDERGNLQLVTPRRYGPAKGTGHRRQTPGRLRSIAMVETSSDGFGQRLLRDRHAIERLFGNLTNWGGGLSCLPAWVRRLNRVRRWVQAKLVIASCKQRLRTTTYVA